jgi:hypothetical protein
VCLQVSYAESIKKWRKITTTTKNQIQSWPFIYKPGEHRQQFKGEKKRTQLRAQWVRPNASEKLTNVPSLAVFCWVFLVLFKICCKAPYQEDIRFSYNFLDCVYASFNKGKVFIFISLTKIKDIVEILDELCLQCSWASMFT